MEILGQKLGVYLEEQVAIAGLRVSCEIFGNPRQQPLEPVYPKSSDNSEIKATEQLHERLMSGTDKDNGSNIVAKPAHPATGDGTFSTG